MSELNTQKQFRMEFVSLPVSISSWAFFHFNLMPGSKLIHYGE